MRGSGKVPLALSVVLSAYVAQQGEEALAQSAGEERIEKSAKRSAASLKAGAARGDPDSLYWLAMLHIDGTIDDADYDLGVNLLKRASFKGHKDAQRMYTFMDNAFSGEGC